VLAINFKDGSSETLDLATRAGNERWIGLRGHVQRISGLSLVVDRHHYTVPFPRKFHRVKFDAQVIRHNKSGKIIGEALRVFVDNVFAEFRVYRNKRPRMVRCVLERRGTPVYVPGLDD